MSSFDSTLFLGIAIDDSLQEILESANPYLVSLFTKGGLYLKEIDFNEKKYLGKFLPQEATLLDLDMIEKNVISLLRRLHPALLSTSSRVYCLAVHDL